MSGSEDRLVNRYDRSTFYCGDARGYTDYPIAEAAAAARPAKLDIRKSIERYSKRFERATRRRNRFVVVKAWDSAGYYPTSDAGLVDAAGYAYVMARTDDVINVAGHRLSPGQIEEVIAEHKDVAECAAIGVQDALKGQLPVGVAVLDPGAKRNHEDIEAEIVAWCGTR